MKRRIFYVVVVLISLAAVVFVFIVAREDASRKIDTPLLSGNISVPIDRTIEYRDSSFFKNEIIRHWSKGMPTDWIDGEKVDLKNPRIVLACLASGQRIDEINQYLIKQSSTGVSGSRWLLNPKGGYNFCAMAMTPVLYLFGTKPHILYPDTREHLIKNILTIEGTGFTRHVPRLYIHDSENHILMTESSRYLKNQWMFNHGDTKLKYNNVLNGVQEGLVSYLEELSQYGVWEFNSDPYLGYSYCALLNLHAFAEGKVKSLSEQILDRINWQYALGSYRFKHFPPYRRRYRQDFNKDIDDNYHTAMMKVWTSMYSDTLETEINRGQHHALWACLMPYRPPDTVMEWTLKKPHPYFVKIGHGYNSCPEIYSGAPEYLLSAGGANQGRSSMIVPKPIVLFLNHEAAQLYETFHMYGPGEDLMEWNNTGVYIDFACTKGPVHIPKGMHPVMESGRWQVYDIAEDIYLAVYSEDNLGIMAIIRATSSEQAIHLVLQNNADSSLLQFQFMHPNGHFIEYDLNSSRDSWVIKKVNGQAVNRQFDSWPFFEGNIDEIGA